MCLPLDINKVAGVVVSGRMLQFGVAALHLHDESKNLLAIAGLEALVKDAISETSAVGQGEVVPAQTVRMRSA